MEAREKETYFLYGEGKPLDALCLGNLVLGSYSNPTIVPHYTHSEMSGDELRMHAWLNDFTDRIVYSTQGPNYGIQLNAQLIDFDVSWKMLSDIVLSARSGTRAELKDPVNFLNSQVLQAGSEARAKLKLWLSAATSDYILRMKWLRTPTIWMCTGLYVLEGTRLFTKRDDQFHATVGVTAATLGTLTGMPIGGSIKISPNKSLKMEAASEQRLVWAAQFRKIEAKYIRLGDGETPTLPNVIPLHPDVTSRGTLRRGSKQPNSVQISIANDEDDITNGKPEDLVSQETYNNELAKVIVEFEEAYSKK